MISDTTRINDIQKEELFQITKADIQMLGEGEKKERKSGVARKELDEMVGLDSVKTVIHKAIAKHKINKLCMEKGLQMDKASLHMVFTENLGTAKTTVARLFAEIMKDEKILSTGVFVEAGRADLVGEHVGATAPMVKKKFKEAEMNLAERICQMDKTKIATEVLTTIEESDIPAIPLETKRQIKKIGFAC